MSEYRVIYYWDHYHWTVIYHSTNINDIHHYIQEHESEMYDVYDESIPHYFEFLHLVDGEVKCFRDGAPDELMETIEYIMKKQA